MSLQSNAISHWLGTHLESALYIILQYQTKFQGIIPNIIENTVMRMQLPSLVPNTWNRVFGHYIHKFAAQVEI